MEECVLLVLERESSRIEDAIHSCCNGSLSLCVQSSRMGQSNRRFNRVFLEEADLFSPSLSTAREYRCPSCPDWVQYRRSAGAFRRFAVSSAKTPQCVLPLSSERRFLPPYSPTHPFFGPFPDQQRNTRNRSPFLSLRHSVDHRPHRRGAEEEETDEPEQGSP